MRSFMSRRLASKRNRSSRSVVGRITTAALALTTAKRDTRPHRRGQPALGRQHRLLGSNARKGQTNSPGRQDDSACARWLFDDHVNIDVHHLWALFRSHEQTTASKRANGDQQVYTRRTNVRNAKQTRGGSPARHRPRHCGWTGPISQKSSDGSGARPRAFRPELTRASFLEHCSSDCLRKSRASA